MTDIYTEIEDDLRRDRLQEIWKRYGTYFVAVALICVFAAAAWVIWQDQKRRQSEAAAEAFAAAMALADQEDFTGAYAAFDRIARSGAGSGYPLLALLNQAALAQARGDFAGAIRIYEQFAASSADERLKSVAAIRAAYLAADLESPDQIRARVAAFNTDTHPFRFEAREILAIAALKAGDMAGAEAAFRALSTDAGAPQGLSGRALRMADYIASGARPADPPPAPAPPAEPAPEATAPAEAAPPSPQPQPEAPR